MLLKLNVHVCVWHMSNKRGEVADVCKTRCQDKFTLNRYKLERYWIHKLLSLLFDRKTAKPDIGDAVTRETIIKAIAN